MRLRIHVGQVKVWWPVIDKLTTISSLIDQVIEEFKLAKSDSWEAFTDGCMHIHRFKVCDVLNDGDVVK